LNQPDRIPSDIAEQLARANGRLGPFAGQVAWYATVGSTNDIASRMAISGAAEGRVIAANAQVSGRGRLGRDWASPAGAGLYVSVILRPAPRVASLLTIAAGVALAEGIEAASGLAAAVKWPNDLYVGNRKLAGILAEAGVGGGAAHVVLGFGVNLMTVGLPPAIAARATSIEGELGRPADRARILVECLAALASRYAQLRSGASADVMQAWRHRAASMLRRSVEWDSDGATHRGVAEDIDNEGSLLVRTASGTERIISGEVRWI
jgi:BirA family transcriptional regulator, biotin operon repressor / biotin---[acetyl-CoA-carboxylase] ligase